MGIIPLVLPNQLFHRKCLLALFETFLSQACYPLLCSFATPLLRLLRPTALASFPVQCACLIPDTLGDFLDVLYTLGH